MGHYSRTAAQVYTLGTLLGGLLWGGAFSRGRSASAVMGVSAYRMEPLADNRALIMRAGGVACAIPLAQVVETMRPLPTRPLAALPDWVSGVAIIRGAPVPVIALAVLVGTQAAAASGRFVTLRVGNHRVALLVDEVVGIAELGREHMAELPGLFSRLKSGMIEAIGQLDSELLLMIRTARLVPDSVWQRLESSAEAVR